MEIGLVGFAQSSLKSVKLTNNSWKSHHAKGKGVEISIMLKVKKLFKLFKLFNYYDIRVIIALQLGNELIGS